MNWPEPNMIQRETGKHLTRYGNNSKLAKKNVITVPNEIGK